MSSEHHPSLHSTTHKRPNPSPERREAIAQIWASALLRAGYLAWGARELRPQLSELIEQAVDVLSSRPFDAQAARAIGSKLARLGNTSPRALGSTLAVLGQQFAVDQTPEDLAALQPSLTTLLAEIATAFSEEAGRNILNEQEA